MSLFGSAAMPPNSMGLGVMPYHSQLFLHPGSGTLLTLKNESTLYISLLSMSYFSLFSMLKQEQLVVSAVTQDSEDVRFR